MKILLLLPKGVEILEASAFIDVFGWNKLHNPTKTEIITCGFTREIITTYGIPIKVDILIEEVSVKDYDALAVPGGFEEFGFYDEAFDERFLEIIGKFNDDNKYIASICTGALPLGKSGILKGKKATTYHLSEGKRQKQLEGFGATIGNESIITEGNIITSHGPSTALGVAFKLLEMLTSPEEAEKTKELMGF